MISQLEHYNIDTIEAKPVDLKNMTEAQRCRYRADYILRKYPELYHAADKVEILFDRWVENETKYLETVFINKDKEHLRTYNKKSAEFQKRLDRMNFIYPLCAALYDETNSELFREPVIKENISDTLFTRVYEKIMFSVKDGMKTSNSTNGTNEMRTAASKARKAWNEYINALPELLQLMPSETTPQLSNAFANIKALHYIDLHNCYASYWNKGKQEWLLKDSDDMEAISNHPFIALNMCPWFEKAM